jgi:hypothetical protein
MKFIDLIWNKVNILNQYKANQRRKIENLTSGFFFLFYYSGFNACQFNPEHELFACGSVEVTVQLNVYLKKNENFLSLGSCRML